MSDAFALVLKKHRQAKALSQELLAERAGLHPTYIGLVERRLRNPSLNTAKALANGLDMPLGKADYRGRKAPEQNVIAGAAWSPLEVFWCGWQSAGWRERAHRLQMNAKRCQIWADYAGKDEAIQ